MGKDKGGGGGYEAPDSLKSQAIASGIDLICEGPIKGLVNEFQSVYINDTPLVNGDGTRNFPRVNIFPRYGTLTQEPVRGISSVESEHAVNQRISIANGAVTRQIAEADIDSLRVTIGIPALALIDTSTGDTRGTSVALKFELQPDGGAWSTLPLFFQLVGATWNAGGYWVSDSPLTYRMTLAFRAFVRWDSSDPANAFVTLVSQYRLQGSGTWIDRETRTIHAAVGQDSVFQGGDGNYYVDQFTDGTMAINLTSPGTYEFRIVATAGNGSVVIGPGHYHSDPENQYELPLTADAFGYAETLTIAGKAGSKYQRSVLINPKEVGAGPWNLRITRLTADSGSQYLQNETWWDSYTEIQDETLTYPNTALMGFQVDAKQFPSVPKRGYDLYLKIVKIPSNYNPVTKQYTGVWDGTFTTGWTDNPAWCFYDLVTNARYGLGDYIAEALVDKWALYTIGQYCDALVPSGRRNSLGNIIYEPRFTLNCLIFNREEAYKVVSDLASVFRGMAYWAGGSIVAVQDAPSDPVALFSPANVVGGLFQYSGTSKRARHTAVLVTWNDPANLFKSSVEYVEDRAGIARYGYNPINLGGFGCISQGMAHRIGRWLLYTEQSETEVVTFRTGINSAYLRPGNAILVADPDRAGVRFGGRLVSATASALTLDASVTLVGGQTYSATVELTDGTVQSRDVTNSAGSYTVLNLASALGSVPAPNAMWILTASNVEPQIFKVLALAEANRGEIEITALSHNPDKYAFVEQGLALGSPPITVRPPPDKVEPPTNLLAEFSEIILNPDTRSYRLSVSWEKSPSPHVTEYICEYRPENGNWTEIMPSSRALLQRHIDSLNPGDYEVRVCAVNILGVRSAFVSDTATLYAAVLPILGDPAFIDARCTYTDKIQLEWIANPDPILGYYELRTDLNWGNPTNMLYQGKGTTYTMKPTGAMYTFYLRAHDTLFSWSAGYDSISLTMTVPAPTFVAIDAISYRGVRIEWLPMNEEFIVAVEVWRAEANDRADVTFQMVGSVNGSVFLDANVLIDQSYWYWIRARSIFDTYSAWETGSTNGHAAMMTLSGMIDDLQGQITEGALVPELLTRIQAMDPSVYAGILEDLDYIAGLQLADGDRLDNAEVLIDAANSRIELKAEQVTVANQETRLSQAEILIDANTTEINLRATLVELGVVDGKADDAVADAAQALNDAAAAVSTANAADATADAAQDDATAALSTLSDIASDSVLTPVEKSATEKEWQTITQHYYQNVAQADRFSVSRANYDAMYSALDAYLDPLLANLAVNSNIAGSEFRGTFTNYYVAEGALLTAITDVARARADQAQADADFLAGIVEELGLRINSAEINIDGANAEITLKASKTGLNAVAAEMTLAANQWTVKINGAGRVAGVGLLLDPVSGASDFVIMADSFAVVNYNDNNDVIVPFVIGTINGVTKVGIGGDVIVDGAVYARSMRIGGWGKAINMDPDMLDPTAWSGGATLQTVSDGKEGNRTLRNPSGAYSDEEDIRYYPVDRNKTYRLSFWARAQAGTNGVLYSCLRQFKDSAGTYCDGNYGRAPYKPAENVAAHTPWTFYSGLYEPADFQTDCRFVRVNFLLNYTGSAGYWEVQHVLFEEAIQGALIVNGAVEARHITATGITLSQLHSGDGSKLAGIATGATKNIVSYQGTAPSNPTDGDVWVDVSGSPYITKVRVSGSWLDGATVGATGAQIASIATAIADAEDAVLVADDARIAALASTYGKTLYRDPTFIDGNNGASVYNNEQNGTVVLSRTQQTDSPNYGTTGRDLTVTYTPGGSGEVERLDTADSVADSLTLSYPVSAGTNRYLVVVVEMNNGVGGYPESGVDYGGQGMTLLESAETSGDEERIAIYGLKEAGIAAASGSTITVSGVTAPGLSIHAASYEGVNQTTPVPETDTANTNAATPNPLQLSISAGAGSAVVSASSQGIGGSGGGGNDFSGDSNCKAWWRLENGALTTDSKSSNTLTNNGSVTADTGDYKEGAASVNLNGSTQYFSRTDSNLASGFPLKSGESNATISVCGFMKLDAFGNPSYWWAKYSATTGGRSLALKINSDGQVGMNKGHTDGTSYDDILSGIYLSTGVWYHVAMTYNNSNRGWHFRVWNMNTNALTGDATGTASNTIYINNQAVAVGRRSDAAGYLDGHIDEVVVFSDILSTSEIDQIRAGTYGSSGSTAAWHADLTVRTTEYSVGGNDSGASMADGLFAGAETATCECTWTSQDRAVAVAIELAPSTGAGASPGFGGFCFAPQTRPNQILITRIVAKIPYGRSLAWAGNAAGDGSVEKWLTPVAGLQTPRFEEYVHYLRCGSTGTFSTAGHYYITGGADEAFSWYNAFATVYDLSMSDIKTIDAAATTANWAGLSNIPARLAESPSGSGLFMTPSYMGFYTNSAWKTYMDNAGNFVLGDFGGGNAGLSWNQGSGVLQVKGSITLQAGAVDASHLLVGRGGTNLIKNAGFVLGKWYGWTPGWSGFTPTYASDLAGWFVDGGHTPYIYQSGETAGYGVLGSDFFSVTPGERLEFYCYTGAHRCVGLIYVRFYAGANHLSDSATYTNDEEESGGTALSGYKQMGGFVTVPSTATRAQIHLVKPQTKSGQGNSYLFFTQPYVGIATANQTEFSPWSEGGLDPGVTLAAIEGTLSVAGGGIVLSSGGAMIRSGNYAAPTGSAEGVGFKVSDNGNIELYGTDQAIMGRAVHRDAGGTWMTTVGCYANASYLTTHYAPINSTYFPSDGRNHSYRWSGSAWVEYMNMGDNGAYIIYCWSPITTRHGIFANVNGSGATALHGVSQSAAGGAAIRGEADSSTGYGAYILSNYIGVYASGNTGVGVVALGAKAAIKLSPTATTTPPSHAADVGSIVVNSNGDTYINVTGGSGYGAWRTVGIALADLSSYTGLSIGSQFLSSNGSVYYLNASGAWHYFHAT